MVVFHWLVVGCDYVMKKSSFFKVSHFLFLIYILLGSPLYNKNRLWDTHNITINPPYKKEIPMDYNNVQSLV